MTLAASGDFLRANDPDVLRRLVAAEALAAAPTEASVIAALGFTPATAAQGALADTALQSAIVDALDAAPVDAVAATNTLTSNNTQVTADDTVTVNGKVYTFKAALTPTEGEILIGADADGSLTNLVRAIMHTGTPDTDYKCAAVHPTVSAGAVAAHAITLTAKTKGVAGNALTLAKSAVTLTVGGATFSGGVDGTPGAAGTLGNYAGVLYHCKSTATIATAGAWEVVTPTQASILAALSTTPEFAGGATFNSDVRLEKSNNNPLLLIGAAGQTGSIFARNAFQSLTANGTNYYDYELYANTFYWATGLAGDVDAMILNANGSAEFYAGIILPTADPEIAGAWWDNAGTLTKSSGP